MPSEAPEPRPKTDGRRRTSSTSSVRTSNRTASMGDQQDHHEDTGKIDRADLARIAFVAAAAAAVWFRVWEPFAGVSVLGLVGTLGGGWPIFHEAWENIRQRRM